MKRLLITVLILVFAGAVWGDDEYFKAGKVPKPKYGYVEIPSGDKISDLQYGNLSLALSIEAIMKYLGAKMINHQTCNICYDYEVVKIQESDNLSQKIKPKTCWEYYFVSFLSQEELKKMGNMEWELVSVAPIYSMPGANVYYFKRPVECGVNP